LSIIVLFAFLSISSFSQTASLKGRLVSKKSKEAAAGVLVKLNNEKKDKTLTTISDNDGNFLFRNIPAGEYKLKTKSASYNEYEKNIDLNDNQLLP